MCVSQTGIARTAWEEDRTSSLLMSEFSGVPYKSGTALTSAHLVKFCLAPFLWLLTLRRSEERTILYLEAAVFIAHFELANVSWIK